MANFSRINAVVGSAKNLLTPNQASLETDLTGVFGSVISVARVADPAAPHGGYVGEATATVDAGGSVVAWCGSASVQTVTPGRSYTATAKIKAGGATGRVCLRYMSATSTALLVVYGATITDTSGYTVSEVTAVAPAGTVYAEVRIYKVGGVTGQSFRWDCLGLMDGEVTWAPPAEVKTAGDLWYVVDENLRPAMSAWAVKGGTLVKVWERYGGATTMVWRSPTVTTTTVNQTVTWQVMVDEMQTHLADPSGRVKFTWQDGHVEYAPIADRVATVNRVVTAAGTVRVTAALESDNGFTAAAIAREIQVTGGKTTITFTAPGLDQVHYGPCDVTWTVNVASINNVVPVGVVRFAGPGGSKDVAIDAAGNASATFTHGSGQRSVTADLLSSSNGFTADFVSHRIRLLINTQHTATTHYTYASHRNYEGANGGPQSTTPIVCGDYNGKSWRALVMLNRPAKPHPAATVSAAWVVYTPATQSALVRCGWHPHDSYPATGTYVGVYQDLVAGAGTQNVEQWVDIGWHVANSLNNETLRGLVFGGPKDATPYSWVTVVGRYCGLVVDWSWWTWDDT